MPATLHEQLADEKRQALSDLKALAEAKARGEAIEVPALHRALQITGRTQTDFEGEVARVRTANQVESLRRRAEAAEDAVKRSEADRQRIKDQDGATYGKLRDQLNEHKRAMNARLESSNRDVLERRHAASSVLYDLLEAATAAGLPASELEAIRQRRDRVRG